MPTTAWKPVESAPVGQGACDAIAQVARAAAIEVHQVPDLQPDQVVRVAHVVEVHRARGRDPVAGDELIERRELRAFARVEGQRSHRGRQVARHCGGRRFGRQAEDERLEQVRLREVRRVVHGLVEPGERITVDVEAAHGLVECGGGCG
jgi:hypothetical protein